jgi:hypothetical protein
MKTIIVLLVAFLCIGIFAHNYNKWTRLLLGGVVVAVVVYLSIG